MRIARKLALLCATAIAALALTAGTATAEHETPVEVSHEQGPHCDPCVVEIESVETSEIVSHIFGHEEVAMRCVDHFVAEIWEDGSGHITEQTLSQPPVGVCTQQPCQSAGESEWPISEMGETGPSQGHFHVLFCLEGAQGEIHCHAEVEIEETGPHHYTLHTDQHCPIFPGVETEFTGHWEIHGNPIEIEHL